MANTYSVGLAGESFRQDAIQRCHVGDEVLLLPDPGNPHDPRAVTAFARDEPIGFLPRDGWLTDVILDQGMEPSAVILSMTPAGGGHLGVVLKVIW